jgi:NADPH-dependent curcumin reductase CurA
VSASPDAGDINRRFVLARRPFGLPQPDDFRLERVARPEAGPGQLLVRNRFISVDPGTRGRLGDRNTYAAPLALGDVIQGATVGTVEVSHHPKFAVGDWVAAAFGWQDWGVSDGRGVRVIPDNGLPPSTAIGILGIPGLTAYFGMLEVGAMKAGDHVLVTSAAGAVGSAAGQIAMIEGARVVGVAGGALKCGWLTGELGFAGAIDHRQTANMSAAVAAACPHGVDVLFDNVGNAMIDCVLPLMNRGGRIVVCGQMADYNQPTHEAAGLKNTLAFIGQRLTMRGLVAFDHYREYPQAWARMTEWISQGRLKYREEVIDGFTALPQAFIGLFTGDNLGRRVVRPD